MPEDVKVIDTDQLGNPIGEQQSEPQDQAAEAEPEVTSEATPDDDGGQTPEEQSVELLGREKFESLRRDPDKLLKELNRAATAKFQELARDRKTLEPYTAFVQALDEDPRAATIALAQKLGLKVEMPPDQQPTKQQAMKLGERVMQAVRQSLGPEYEDLADKLAPAIFASAAMVASETIAPLEARTRQIIDDSAARESASAIEVFGKKHPDWKQHERAMVDMSTKILPGEGMNEQEYLEILYSQVTRDTRVGDGVQKVLAKVKNAARDSDRTGGTPRQAVSTTPARLPTFREAWAAAKRGERFE